MYIYLSVACASAGSPSFSARCLHWPSAEVRSQGEINYLVLRCNGSSAKRERKKNERERVQSKKERERERENEPGCIRYDFIRFYCGFTVAGVRAELRSRESVGISRGNRL